MRGQFSKLIALSLVMILAGSCATAEETHITVRARSHDGKFIGTSVGGMDVMVRDATTDELLASGRIRGDTGDTEKLMKQPTERGDRLAGPGTAKYVTEFDVDKPTRVRVELVGPSGAGTTDVVASQTLWVLPGEDIGGDGLVFDLHGFIVRPISPAPNQRWEPGQPVPVRAWVSMMCGCHIWPDGLWDATDYKIDAIIEDADGNELGRIPLSYADEKSTFEGSFTPPGPGSYKLTITASDPKNGNYGACVTGFSVK